MTLREHLRRLEPFWSDWAIAASSVWAAAFMFWYPTDFDRFPMGGVAYDLMQRIAQHERWWAIFVLIAASAKVAGLACLVNGSLWGVSIILRKIGLAMSFLWWTVLGISAMSGGYLILGFLPCLVGFRSAWLVFAETELPS